MIGTRHHHAARRPSGAGLGGVCVDNVRTEPSDGLHQAPQSDDVVRRPDCSPEARNLVDLEQRRPEGHEIGLALAHPPGQQVLFEAQWVQTFAQHRCLQRGAPDVESSDNAQYPDRSRLIARLAAVR